MDVLVAEDSRYYRKILENILTEWDYQVVLAEDGDKALQILQEADSPRLVVMDWVMPGMTGIEICKTIKSRESNHYTYIILLTSMNGKENILLGLESGADDYIVKPFDQQELRYRLRIGERIISLENKILQLAMTDYLTGLLNRRAFMERLEGEIERSRRFGLQLCLVMIDLDNFKKVNDNYGHQAGDAVLSAVAGELSKHIRKYDLLARYGGEEFILCLSGSSLHNAARVAERLREGIEKNIVNTKGFPCPLHLTASLGIACFNDSPGENVDNLIKRADEALYQAKQDGKNRVCLNTSALL